jgi:dTMP kinase
MWISKIIKKGGKMEKKRGKFIVLEGINGAGKTTQAEMLAKKIKNAGRDVICTKEPTRWTIPGMILAGDYELTKKGDWIEMANKGIIDASLFLLDRMQHILDQNLGILHILDSGKDVVCDRFYWSFYVYNGFSIGYDRAVALNESCTKLLTPDLTFFIDVPTDVCRERIEKRNDCEKNRTEAELCDLRDRYLDAFSRKTEADGPVMHVECGSGDKDAVADAIWKETQQFFSLGCDKDTTVKTQNF